MDFKKLLSTLFLIPLPLLLILLPISAAALFFAFTFFESASPLSVAAYVISAYTLAALCARIPRIIKGAKRLKRESPYLRRWQEDRDLRISVSLYGPLILNTLYAALQLGLGIYHRTLWFTSLSAYYFSLALMRLFLIRHTRKHRLGESIAEELKRYRACGIVFLIMNLALSLIIFFMVYWNRTFTHHEITTIALGAYTFTSLSLAIAGVIKQKKARQSPVFRAAKAISLASACVSVLTLEATMLTTFGGESFDLAGRRILLAASGGAVSAFIIAMAIYMIASATKSLKKLHT